MAKRLRELQTAIVKLDDGTYRATVTHLPTGEVETRVANPRTMPGDTADERAGQVQAHLKAECVAALEARLGDEWKADQYVPPANYLPSLEEMRRAEELAALLEADAAGLGSWEAGLIFPPAEGGVS